MNVAQVAAIEERTRSLRTKAIDRLASGVAHELGTPMNVISVRAELIVELANSEDVVASAKVIKSQIDSMAGVIRRMLDFARRRPLRRESVDLVGLLARLIDSTQTSTEGRAIQFQLVDRPRSLFIEVDPAQIDQALRNLLINAIQALPSAGNVCVTTERGTYRPRTEWGEELPVVDCARIEVRDNGVGIPKEALPHLFDPFFTTRHGEALGLGLSVASCIVEDHGGWIDVDSQPGKGSCFSVFLPLCAAH
jgi:two-component system NtrC family sensor kinase